MVNQTVESVISLLDISNHDEYKWTNLFVPPPDSTETSTITNINKSITTGALVGVILGSLVGGVLLSICGFLLYKRKVNQAFRKVLPTPGENIDPKSKRNIP